MNGRRWLILSCAVGATVVAVYFANSTSRPAPGDNVSSVNAPAKIAAPPAGIAATAAQGDTPTRYFFDVHGHTADEIMALLDRAKDTYDSLPADLQDALSIAMVLHGPDVEFFATTNYARYRELVDLAAKLDAFGFIDLKVCAASVRSRGLETDRFPPFIELVPYGPAEVSRLESTGYVEL